MQMKSCKSIDEIKLCSFKRSGRKLMLRFFMRNDSESRTRQRIRKSENIFCVFFCSHLSFPPLFPFPIQPFLPANGHDYERAGRKMK